MRADPFALHEPLVMPFRILRTYLPGAYDCYPCCHFLYRMGGDRRPCNALHSPHVFVNPGGCVNSCGIVPSRSAERLASPWAQVQRQTTQHSAGLEGRVLQQLGLVRSDFEMQITGTSEKLSTALRQLEGHALKGNEGITTTLGSAWCHLAGGVWSR